MIRQRTIVSREKFAGPEYMPTPDEIAAATAQIRSEWSEKERRSRECSPFGNLEYLRLLLQRAG